MSLLDNASLLLTPNAYKEGKLYSVIPSNGNGDFTATRATTATRVNAAGLVDLVPYNLLQYSEMFSDGYWSKSVVTIIPNDTTAPNGTMTADKLYPTSSGNFRHIRQTSFSPYTGLNTMSIYAKKAELSNLTLVDYDGSGAGINFNLNTGVATDYATTPFVSYSMTDVGDGWYRCTATALNGYFYWMVTNGGNLVTVTANGTDGIYLWGAQIVEGTSARDYLRTETRLNIPRIDYSLGGCPNILLEPQRTNLALQSSSFDSASWSKSNSSITANSTTSPSGIVDADTLTANGLLFNHQCSQTLSTTSGTAYTISFYLKKDTNNFAQIGGSGGAFGANAFANFDLNSGVVGSVGAGTTAAITSVGNGWFRCSMTVTATATISGSFAVYLVTSATAARFETNTLNTSVFLWGAQVEAGAYSTSFIPTTTASVTRNADSITRNNIFTNGLITAAGGTWFVELRNNRVLTRDAVGFTINIDTDSNTRNNGFFISNPGTSNRVSIFKAIAAGNTSLYQTLTDTVKIAIKWNGSTADVFVNGVKVVSATAFTTTAMQHINTQTNISAFINEMALFPTPLTDAQCLALTA